MQKKYSINIEINRGALVSVIVSLSKEESMPYEKVLKIIQKNPSPEGRLFSKTQILTAYDSLKAEKAINLSKLEENNFKRNIRMKKVRTISGVTPVTVLTKPFPCPGQCIFCPNDVRMPKSYISDEPGAQRANINHFDPYLQTFNRLIAIRNMGHPTDKIELIVLGGTWTHYPDFYQIWFVKRCFDAMNDFGDSNHVETLPVTVDEPLNKDLLEEVRGEVMNKNYNQVVAKALTTKISEQKGETATWNELESAHKINADAKSRCVGLVVETRPDEITEDELIRIRRLGATKIQLGIQSLDDEVLKKNKRGHGSETTRKAINLIRQAGFKIHGHWMPNLYGSNPEKDITDYKKLFSDKNIRPDELKIYPCSLLESAELMQFYKSGMWKPYTQEELAKVLEGVFLLTERYCRLTRVVRDIPSTDIVVGNKKTNLRQIIERDLDSKGIVAKDIRAREIRDDTVKLSDLSMKITEYETGVSQEVFIEFITKEDKIAAFLRLSLPTKPAFIDELEDAAIIREIHVYGQSIEIGDKKEGKAQHLGLGTQLNLKAENIAKEKGYKKISVISSIGTRRYYEKLGYTLEKLYQHKLLF